MTEETAPKREILGVYSHSTRYQYQFGERESRYRGGTYWFVSRRGEDRYEVQPLNSYHVPAGPPKVVDEEEFLQFYTPELEYYRQNTIPALEKLAERMAKGRRYFRMGQLTKAEVQFCKAVLMDEMNVEANVGLGTVYAEQQQFSKLREVLDRLMDNDLIFREQQRHQFNAFGMTLRQKGLFDDAVRFYRKALELNGEDEHLHFNLARAYFEKNLRNYCLDHLYEALRLNPGFLEASRFLDLVEAEE